jgi:hypothetical protein
LSARADFATRHAHHLRHARIVGVASHIEMALEDAAARDAARAAFDS